MCLHSGFAHILLVYLFPSINHFVRLAVIQKVPTIMGMAENPASLSTRVGHAIKGKHPPSRPSWVTSPSLTERAASTAGNASNHDSVAFLEILQLGSCFGDDAYSLMT